VRNRSPEAVRVDHGLSECLRILLRDVVSDAREDPVLVPAGEPAAVSGAVRPHAVESLAMVMVGTVMTGLAASRRS
jgi:hypothetical protein